MPMLGSLWNNIVCWLFKHKHNINSRKVNELLENANNLFTNKDDVNVKSNMPAKEKLI